MPNPFVHVELNTDDLKKAEKFYRSVFAWKLSPMPGGMPYTMIDTAGGTGGGMQKHPMPGSPNAWLPYVLVDDVKTALAKATKNGGRVAVDYMEIEGMGALGVFIDPTGAMLGVWEMKPPAKADTTRGSSKKKAGKKKAASKTPVKKSAKKKSAKKR